MNDVKFIEGDGIYFREPRLSDLNFNWYNWLNDNEVTRFQNKGIFPNSIEKQTSYFNYITNSSKDVLFSIIEKENNIHIGCVGLHKIDWISRSAELGIIIGEKDYWGKKFGSQSWKMISDYGFKSLNLHRISSIIIENNKSSEKCAINSGYKKEGKMRDYLYKNGKYLNAIIYSKLNEGE